MAKRSAQALHPLQARTFLYVQPHTRPYSRCAERPATRLRTHAPAVKALLRHGGS